MREALKLGATEYVQLSATGELHRMEAGHAGKNASNPMPGDLITISKYRLCGHCFPEGEKAAKADKAEVKEAKAEAAAKS